MPRVTHYVPHGVIPVLQYTQTVLLNFNGLSWPHITVGTLKRTTRVA
jgi:hypothetical protein